MTTVYGSTVLDPTGGVQMDVAYHGARVRSITAKITLASQPTSNTIPVAFARQGWTFLYGVHTTDTSLGSSTVAVGITGSTAKYKAAATFTATDTPTIWGKAAAITKLTAAETLFITIAAATMPSSGTYIVTTFWGGT